MLGIPYTGSDPLALAVALEKDFTRRLVADAGVTVPKGITFRPPPVAYDGDFAEFAPVLAEAGLTLPVIAKPVFEGSSKGVRNRCLIERAEDLGPTVVSLWNDYQQTVLVEEFIAGDEVTLGLVGNDPPRVLGIMRILPRVPTDRFVYSLEMKRDYEQHLDYELRARLGEDVVRELEATSFAVWDALGLRDVARLDFRVRDGVPYFLEVNPLPGLNPESSDLVYLARGVNVTHAQLITEIFEAAVARVKAGG
jgi:D-alanine-D-alanine ligase